MIDFVGEGSDGFGVILLLPRHVVSGGIVVLPFKSEFFLKVVNGVNEVVGVGSVLVGSGCFIVTCHCVVFDVLIRIRFVGFVRDRGRCLGRVHVLHYG